MDSWTNPALESEESARTFFQSGGWHNFRGDRTWLAPEIDIFFPSFPSLEGYRHPRELDPGSYQVTGTASGLRLVSRMVLEVARVLLGMGASSGRPRLQ